jgi:hypothetical protein
MFSRVYENNTNNHLNHFIIFYYIILDHIIANAAVCLWYIDIKRLLLKLEKETIYNKLTFYAIISNIIEG